jgi:hypothetical protein
LNETRKLDNSNSGGKRSHTEGTKENNNEEKKVERFGSQVLDYKSKGLYLPYYVRAGNSRGALRVNAEKRHGREKTILPPPECKDPQRVRTKIAVLFRNWEKKP